MKKIIVSLIASMTLLVAVNAQQLKTGEINYLLDNQGELTFEFNINRKKQLNKLSKILTIISFDRNTNKVKAWANRIQFNDFLKLDINYKAWREDNNIDERLMSNDISYLSKNPKQGYTLEFPLTVYPTYLDYASQMQNFEAKHPDIVDFFSIGKTSEGDKELLFVKLSDNVLADEAEPKLLYSSSIHGDEVVGFPMMLNLIDYLITAYKDNTHPDHKRIFKLINSSEIWINPNANPDGTYHLSPDNTSIAFARRGNMNNIDLNRNYPDNIKGEHSDGVSYQTETLHFMELASNHNFVIAANFHDGAELVNYPWDNTYDRHPDDAWWILTASEYRDNTHNNSTFDYMSDKNNGITHGADWYKVHGSRQDYMNFTHQCKELTIELSHQKKPAANQLKKFWSYNREALLDYLMQGTYGFRGIISDSNTGEPIKNATIKIMGHDKLGSWAVSDTDGDYYRPIHAGTYDLIFEAPNYMPVKLNNQKINNYQTKKLPNIYLTPIITESQIVNVIARKESKGVLNSTTETESSKKK